MKYLNKSQIEIKKSKFIAYIYQVFSIDEINFIMVNLKKEHKKAVHFPYAYKIDNLIKKSDDKEPANTAGTPIYRMIEQADLNNVLIVVVRYFGGTKLGAGPLTRAYSKSVRNLLSDSFLK